MDPFAYPDDALVAEWSRLYGTTGVKFVELIEHPANAGCIATYRELSLAERQVLARLEILEEQAPDAFDVPRMAVQMALLYPTLDAFPQPVFAAGELYPRIKQHGHGSLDFEEPLYHGLPEHMVHDLRNARQAAQMVFEDPGFTSIYKDLIVLAATDQGRTDRNLLERLWRYTPGQLRDFLSVIEQVQHRILQDVIKDPAFKGGAKERAQIAQFYESPFAQMDRQTQGVIIPHTPLSEDDAPEVSNDPAPVPASTAGGLPPNRPPLKEALARALD